MGRILQFSDIHFGCEHRQATAAALDYAHATPADLTLITGDVTQRGHPDEFQAAGTWIRAMPEPTFVVVGNHDVPYWNAMARLFWPWRAFEATIGHPAHDHQFLGAALMVRGVTTARGWQARLNWSKGVIDLDQTRRAAEALRQAPIGALRVLACHHPLIEMLGAPMTGHVHVPFALPIEMSDRYSYAVGCGTLSLRERGAAPGFNQIDWDSQAITVTAMGWTGDRFEPQQVWRLPRRQDTRTAATAPDPAVAGAMEQAAT